MTKLLVIAKTVITAAGVYVAAFVIEGFCSNRYNFLKVQANQAPDTPIYWLFKQFCDLINHLPLFILAIVAYHLIFNADKWAHRLIGKSQPLEYDENIRKFAYSLCRIMLVFLGAIFTFQYLSSIEMVRQLLAGNEKVKANFNLGGPIMLIIGIYFLIGGSKFADWLAVKTDNYVKKASQGTINTANNNTGKDTVNE